MGKTRHTTRAPHRGRTSEQKPAHTAAVIGAGSWGTTFAKLLCEAGNRTRLWVRRPELVREIQISRRNAAYLPGIDLPKSLKITADLRDAVESAEYVFLAVPSYAMRKTLEELREFLSPQACVISLAKGVERGTSKRMSQVITEALGCDIEQVAVVSGPNIALEIAQEQPTGAVVSCVNLERAQQIASVCTTPYFRTYVNTDVTGTELGGVLKNLIALAIGIVDGVGYGENTKAAIITRGLAEMTEFAVASGANPHTMIGLAGLGDLITTCHSPLSRNSTAGRLIGQGYTQDETRGHLNQVVEGIASVKPVLELAKQRGIEMPIVYQVNMVLDGKMQPKDLGPHLATEDGIAQPELGVAFHAPQRLLSRMRRAFRR